MTNSFFQVKGISIQGRLTEASIWQDVNNDSAGPLIGLAITKRVHQQFNIDANGAILIEKDCNHPVFNAYWSAVTALATQASQELSDCSVFLEGL